MGKRKERRLAAMGAAGRRVKLDLFAEPPGDLGGSSTQDEVGGEDDSKNRAGLPNSPSSSGQQPQNPLLLLGQYSDDEQDDGSKEEGNSDDAEDNLIGGSVERAKVDTGKHDESVGVIEGDDSVMQKVEQFILEMGSATPDPSDNLVEDDNTAKKVTDSDYDHGDTVLAEKTAAVTFDRQTTADVSSSWKMVLHEESNQYYYWNVATGETSWEVPDALAHPTDPAFVEKATADSGQQDDAIMCTHRESRITDIGVDNSAPVRPSDVYNIANQNGRTLENDMHRLEMEGGCKSGAVDDKAEGDKYEQDKLQDNSGQIVKQHCEASLPGDYVSFRPLSDAPVGNGSASIEDSVKCQVDMGHQGEFEAQENLYLPLMKHCEYLLDQLKSLNRCKDEMILKCMVEVEVRISDIKSLASHGSALLPFWARSDKQLKELEATIKKIILHDQKDVQLGELENARKPDVSIADNISENQSACPPRDNFHSSLVAEVEDHKDSYPEAYDDTLASNDVSNLGVNNPAIDAGGPDEVNELASQHQITPQTVAHSGEDADMDVDMEVEDAGPLDAAGSQFPLPAEQPDLQNRPGYQVSSLSEQTFVPPPPVDDWIPPPPPDNEPYPPPPPEEPPEIPLPPPALPESVQTFPYTDQYNQSFPGNNSEYYGQTNTQVPSANFYTYSEGIQVADSQPSVYYEAVPLTYSAAPVMVNPVEPGVYYTLQDGLVHSNSLGGVIESSGIGSVSGHKSFNTDSLGSLNAHVKPVSAIPPTTKDEVLDLGGMGKTSLDVPSSQAITPISMAESVSVPSTVSATTSSADTVTAAKGQTKVSRPKKRTVAVVSTLRSNKKVSSLVDKWKAAKEELHEEEEEEPETYLEKLEKKRQREIEAWRAQQIASGEAKDNANFQPLGGDWRERVKRKRAQLEKERERSPVDGGTGETQQPSDVNELSKALPSGWQAYWDDSSNQVYYGNALTSETSWTRPSS